MEGAVYRRGGWNNSTTNPSGSYKYNVAPPWFGPLVIATGGDLNLTPWRCKTSYNEGKSSTTRQMWAHAGRLVATPATGAGWLRYCAISSVTPLLPGKPSDATLSAAPA